MYKLFTPLFFLVSVACFPQIPAGFPSLDRNDLPDAKFLLTRHFTHESLFGYMNGGAELYREYGISDAVITELDLKGTKYKCEVFKMTGPEQAFGIYSVSRYRCQGSPPLAPYTCQNSYQLALCKGRYYVSIINMSGAIADQSASLRIGKILAGKISEPSFDYKEYLPEADSVDIQRRSVLAEGKLGLMNGATDWEDYFKDLKGYTVMLIPYGNFTDISIRFTDNEALMKFCKLHDIDPGKLTYAGLRISPKESVRVIKENHLILRIGL